jgi:putative transposase
MYREGNGLIWRVEPICETLSRGYGIPISPSGYYAYKHRGHSVRKTEDSRLKERINAIYEENYSCYGVRKIWRALRNEGERVTRCTVERLMKLSGLRGAVRGGVKRTTVAGKNVNLAGDLVKRKFDAPAPDRL